VQYCNVISNAIDGHGDKEEGGRECETWKEKREKYDKSVSSKRLRLWLCA